MQISAPATRHDVLRLYEAVRREPSPVHRPMPVVVTNGPLVQSRVEPVSIVGRFEVSRVPDFTVRQAEPAPDHAGARAVV